MSGLLPSDRDTERETRTPRVLWLDDDDAEQLISSLSSETARSILTELYERDATASELSEAVDTSLQNVRHHLGNLQDAGLVDIVGTEYSVKGREMNVYAPVDSPLVVCAGQEDDRASVLDSLRKFVGVAAILAVGAVLVQWLFGAAVTVSDVGGPGTAPRVGDSVADGVAPLLGTLPPGVAFLAGGALVLAVVLALEGFQR
ncbi:transcriptional regulator [Haloprofundus marisrubri]|uniref:Transcriptional regulator n=1 Tax=Haloprofundus marisrubri TaxID=1514971 RepID=A0A0W1R9S9_9EURY|nr:winged helix-turn-helix domain-containing protein [Haloprofundus marisrubri]KTG10388.1 transcriptional regulator [Haloprofundus marisrubri]